MQLVRLCHVSRKSHRLASRIGCLCNDLHFSGDCTCIYDLFKHAIHPYIRVWYFKGQEEDLEKPEEIGLRETPQLDPAAVTYVQGTKEQAPTPSSRTCIVVIWGEGRKFYRTRFSRT
ncbi:hypothetical protein ARMSODRAFT_371820 [Armillaria solidipes]|uniref:Uncharacterized protein n=1 Tax=Armillaria solidipes TaxID=1076256 RepID=A0A2H3B5P5_9AGAR|nr:hypothetical protein ARMSODRAFT_371820 [Armillaria solidipes]